MKVLHVAASMSPKWGGPPVAVQGLTSALVRQGVYCEIVTARGSTVGNDVLSTPGIPMHNFDTEPPARFWPAYSRKLGGFLDAGAGNFDLIHAHQTMPYTTYAAFRAARKHALPYVLSLRGDLAAWALRHKGFRKWVYRKALLDNVLKSADALHVVSPAEAARAAELCCETPKFMIPNGVALGEPSPSVSVRVPGEVPGTGRQACRSLSGAAASDQGRGRAVGVASRWPRRDFRMPCCWSSVRTKAPVD